MAVAAASIEYEVCNSGMKLSSRICSQGLDGGGSAPINVIGNNKLKIFDRQFSIFMRCRVCLWTDPLHVIREHCVAMTWVQQCIA